LSNEDIIIAATAKNPPKAIFKERVSVPARIEAMAVTTAENGIITETALAGIYFKLLVRIIQQKADVITT